MRDKKVRDRRIFNKWKDSQRRREAKTGQFTGKYQVKKAWFLRKANVPPEVLQAAIDRDKDVARIKRMLATPYRVRKKMLSEKILATRVPPLEKKLQSLMDQVQPYLDKVMSFDHGIRRVLDDIEHAKYMASVANPPTDKQLQTDLKLRAKKIGFKQAHMVLARQKMQLRKLHGNWGKYDRGPRGAQTVGE